MYLGVYYRTFSKVKDRYRLLAPFYTKISQMVFGDVIHQATTYYLSKIPKKSVIIIGGGDGNHFREIQNELKGEYWELSSSMLKRAQKNLSESQLTFHLGDFKSQEKVSCVIFPFVLDTVPDDEIEQLLMDVSYNLEKGGILLLSDFFRKAGFFHDFLTGLMIRIFRVLTAHKRKDLPDYSKFLSQHGFELIAEKQFKKGWIRSQLWEKN